jgi:hypothetical protein
MRIIPDCAADDWSYKVYKKYTVHRPATVQTAARGSSAWGDVIYPYHSLDTALSTFFPAKMAK